MLKTLTKSTNILIIGGNGYIGVALVDYLTLKNNCKITIVDPCYYTEKDVFLPSAHMSDFEICYINCKYQELSKEFFREFSVIILLAGQGSVSNSSNMLNVIDNNIRNFAWLLDLITIDQKLIYASSSSVYGQTDNKDVNENFNNYKPYNFYDWSKQNIDQLISLISPKKHVYSLRFGTVNGFSRNLRNDVMINSMVFNAKTNNKIFVKNSEINRPILAIDDLCNAIYTIILNGKFELSGIYNLNSFNNTIGEIAHTVSNICNVPLSNYTNDAIINFKLQTKSYNFKINSQKFITAFNFEFKGTLESITNQLLDNWNNIQYSENRLVDKYNKTPKQSDNEIDNNLEQVGREEYYKNDKCIICQNKIHSLLDLGSQPLANNYNKIQCKNKEYPLHLYYCEYCYHVQLNCIVNPDILFKNYLYISGTSETLKQYFIDFSIHSLERLSSIKLGCKKIKVLDIACNDGSQLDAFKNYKDFDITTVGVDPAENIYKTLSNKKNHDIYCEFFTQSTVNKLKEKYGEFDIIIAQNVFAHISYPSLFLNLCKQILNDDGFIFIQTSQKDMILESKADTAYHEHISFFNSGSMNFLCNQNELVLNNVSENSIHGTSYIFEITKKTTIESNINEVLLKEINNKIYDKITYKNYKLNCIKYKNNLQNKLIDYKLQNKNIIGFCSSAKSNTILNFAKIDSDIIDFIIDENPLKIGLYAPGSNILITDISALKQINKNTIILNIGWNYEQEIIYKITKKLEEYNINFPITILNMDTLETQITTQIQSFEF